MSENSLVGCKMPNSEWVALNRIKCFEDDSLMSHVAPFPPVNLMANVSGLNTERDFAAHGCDIYVALSAASPVPLVDYWRMLDFGCGCGRLGRILKGFPNELFGCDIDHRHVTWMQENLPFMQVKLTEVHPPLPYECDYFDAIISISIFTHLTESSQDEFLAELHRISSPTGYLFLTVHGQTALDRAKNDDMVRNMLDMNPVLFEKAKRDFNEGGQAFILQGGHLTVDSSLKQKIKRFLGKLVVDEPFEYGISFTPEAYIRQHWSQWFDIVAIHPGAIHNFQDIVVLSPRKAK